MLRVWFGLVFSCTLALTIGCDSAATAPDTPRDAEGVGRADDPIFPFDFSLIDVTGRPLRLADYRGQVVVVEFWGTWCPPCVAGVPLFIRLQETYGPQGVQVIGLNYEGGDPQTDAQTVREFIAEHGINYPSAIGTPEIRDQIPDFEGFPTTVFIDKRGQARVKAVGFHDFEYLESVVKALLSE
jgi:thiol-disulfide isomerase/thioredoxin